MNNLFHTSKGECLDKLEQDVLAFLGLREREMLAKLAERDGRTDLEQLKWLIRARAFGRLKDLGDERVPLQVSEAESRSVLHLKNLKVERDPE